MLKQVVLAHFEPVATGFGSWKNPKCPENGLFWDQKWVENGSKTRFCKSDPSCGCGSGSSARNKRFLYSASSCGIWPSQHGQFIFKVVLHNCRAQTGVGVDHHHATNEFCIAPRLAESGAHSMNSSFSRHFRIIAGLKRVWGWIISTQQTSFV